MASVMVCACSALPRFAPPMAASGHAHAAPHTGCCASILRPSAVALILAQPSRRKPAQALPARLCKRFSAARGYDSLSRFCKNAVETTKKAALFPYNHRNNAALVRCFLAAKISFDAAAAPIRPAERRAAGAYAEYYGFSSPPSSDWPASLPLFFSASSASRRGLGTGTSISAQFSRMDSPSLAM